MSTTFTARPAEISFKRGGGSRKASREGGGGGGQGRGHGRMFGGGRKGGGNRSSRSGCGPKLFMLILPIIAVGTTLFLVLGL